MRNRHCHICGEKSLRWDCDYDAEEMFDDGREGIVHCYHCHHCGADYTVYEPCQSQDQADTPKEVVKDDDD